jgi:threonine/homoserine/homoserine lactone efflux protein
VSLGSYLSYVAFAVVVIVAPGPDFALTVTNTLRAGRPGGMRTALGIATSNTVQGTAAALGLGALIARSELAFTIIRWAGAAYLAYLGISTIRSALRRRHSPPEDREAGETTTRRWLAYQQGFLSNITNPKVLIFYIAVLPQFLTPGAAPVWLLAFAWSHALLSLLYLLTLSTGLAWARALLSRRAVRRAMDGTTSALLLGFSARLAAEHN